MGDNRISMEGSLTAQARINTVKVGEYEFSVRGASWVAIYRNDKLVKSGSDRDEAIVLMLEQLDAARVVVQAARDAVEAPTLRRKELLQEALALHDRLTSDREPPSKWCESGGALSERTVSSVNCLHIQTERGKDVPWGWGLSSTQICLECGMFRQHSHDEDPCAVSGWSAWQSARKYEEMTKK